MDGQGRRREQGGAGADLLSGSFGNDRLIGGAGGEKLFHAIGLLPRERSVGVAGRAAQRELHDLHPGIHIDIDSAQTIRDLGAGEADIALRSTDKSQPAGVVGRALCKDDWTLYCSSEYAKRHGVPRTKEDLKNHALVGGGGGNLWRAYSAWIKELGLEGRV